MARSGSHKSKRRLLCEGWIEGEHHGVMYLPEAAYVRQGDKVWFAEGAQTKLAKSLCESEDFNGTTIVESINDLELVERQLPSGAVTKMPKDGRWFVEGIGQRSGVKNANRRTYAKSIWERIIGNPKSKAQEAVAARGMVGHLEHPSDGRTDGKQVALVTVKAKLNEDGTVFARHELLDTPSGLILQEFTLKGIRWGVSTRGNGTVDDNGNVDESDYEMECWDAVMKPSTPGAYPKLEAATTLTESVTEHADDTKPEWADTELTEADAEATLGLTRKMLDQLADGSIPWVKDNDRITMAGWLKAKLSESLDRIAVLLDDVAVSRSLDESAKDADVSQEASHTVIRQLQERLEQAVRDNEALRQEARQVSEKVDATTAERDSAYEMVESAEADLKTMSAKLDAARSLILAKPTSTVAIPELVEAVITAAPALMPYKDILAESTDLKALRETVAEVVRIITPQPVHKPIVESVVTAPRSSRPPLRLPNVISESDAGKPARLAQPASAGASVAAAALSRR